MWPALLCMCSLSWSHLATAAPTPKPTASASQPSEESIIEVAEHAGEAVGVVFALLVIISILCIITKVITWLEDTEEGQQFARCSMHQIRQWHDHARGGGFYPGQLTWAMIQLVRLQWSLNPTERPARARTSPPRSSQALREMPLPAGAPIINLPIAPGLVYGLTARATSNHMRHAIKALPKLSSPWRSSFVVFRTVLMMKKFTRKLKARLGGLERTKMRDTTEPDSATQAATIEAHTAGLQFVLH